MNTQPTLFSRYKRMINTMLNDGQRSYTAYELNTFVGQYENATLWKRRNSNPYYTTRTYQTLLSDFGCITKIKRGLWQINGPIPEWFGSFHFTGLKRGYDADNKYADHNCQYWKSLPDAHRVNPWKTAPLQTNNTQNMTNNETTTKPEPMHFYTDSTDQLNIDESKNIVDAGMVSVNIKFIVTAPFGAQFECTSWVNLFKKEDDAWGAECAETEMILVTNRSAKYVDIVSMVRLMMGEAAGTAWVASLDKYAEVKAVESQAISKEVVESTIDASNEKTYTKAQVEQILKAFVKHVAKDVQSAVENECESLDESECVDIEFDNYDRRITVELNTSSMARTLSSAASDQVDMSYDDFEIDNVEIK